MQAAVGATAYLLPADQGLTAGASPRARVRHARRRVGPTAPPALADRRPHRRHDDLPAQPPPRPRRQEAVAGRRRARRGARRGPAWSSAAARPPTRRPLRPVRRPPRAGGDAVAGSTAQVAVAPVDTTAKTARARSATRSRARSVPKAEDEQADAVDAGADRRRGAGSGGTSADDKTRRRDDRLDEDRLRHQGARDGQGADGHADARPSPSRTSTSGGVATLRFGVAGEKRKLKAVPRLTPLPSLGEPAHRLPRRPRRPQDRALPGRLRRATRAATARCRRPRTECETVGADARTRRSSSTSRRHDGSVVQYQLDLDKVRERKASSKAVAAKAAARKRARAKASQLEDSPAAARRGCRERPGPAGSVGSAPPMGPGTHASTHHRRRVARPRPDLRRRGPARRARARPRGDRPRHGPPPARPRPRRADEDRARQRRGHRRGPPRPDARRPARSAVANRDYANWEERMNPWPVEAEVPEVHLPRPATPTSSGRWKYRLTDVRNVLERASARETAARVAGGALCKAFLRALGVEVRSHVTQIGTVRAPAREPPRWPSATSTASTTTRCAAWTRRRPGRWSTTSTCSARPTSRSAASSRSLAFGLVPGLGSHVSGRSASTAASRWRSARSRRSRASRSATASTSPRAPGLAGPRRDLLLRRARLLPRDQPRRAASRAA